MKAKDRKLLAVTVAALSLSLLAIAFLLGRMSASLAPVATLAAPSPAVSPASATPGVPAVPSPSFETTPASGESTASRPGLSPSSAASKSVLAAPSASADAANSSDRPRVAAYFADVERLEEAGSGDPQAFAKSLMESITSADFSQYDELLAKAKGRRDRLRSISPPKICANHHRLSLALATDSIALMERLKTALMKGDTMTLLTLSTDGRVLETQAAQVRAEADRVKRLVGL